MNRLLTIMLEIRIIMAEAVTSCKYVIKYEEREICANYNSNARTPATTRGAEANEINEMPHSVRAKPYISMLHERLNS